MSHVIDNVHGFRRNLLLADRTILTAHRYTSQERVKAPLDHPRPSGAYIIPAITSVCASVRANHIVPSSAAVPIHIGMLYQFLISSSGTICGCQPAITAIWGAKECPPLFSFLTLDCTEQEADYIWQECTCVNGKLLYDGQPFTLNDCILRTEYDTPRLSCVAPIENLRLYRTQWIKAVYAYRFNPQVAALLQAIKYGCFADIFVCVKALSPQMRKQILDQVKTVDRDWVLANVVRV